MRTIRQAGGVVLLDGAAVLRRTAAGEWVFAKGHIEPGETPEQAATREAEEELGLRAQVARHLGEYAFQVGDERREVEMFLLVADPLSPAWSQHQGRDAEAVPLPRVEHRLSFDNLREFWRRVQPAVAQIARQTRTNSASDPSQRIS